MSKTVTFTADVYPYCVGDVVTLTDDELKDVDKIAKARKLKAYVVGAKAEVESSAEADRQEHAAEEVVSEAEAQARVDLELASAEHADEQAVNAPSGRTTPGTAADDSVKTAAAAGKGKK